ncbi:MAG: hypothetical protein Ct9H300mP1_33120 [Planctomycetaceae bacterium]|nr:MAG: hypothetical protein Ct9H300mP1_33120 [Planctomycetaceae bacterium]
MQMWKTFLANRAKGFGEFYYLGSEPLDGTGDRVDVLISELGNVRCRWYLDRKQGRLLGFDSRREEDTDECEVRLTGDFESGGVTGQRQSRFVREDNRWRRSVSRR